MALQIRQVNSTLLNPDDSPIVGAKVCAVLRDWSVLSEFVVAPGPIETTTDSSGAFSLPLWANESGPSIGYDLTIQQVDAPNRSKTIKISVPAGTDDIDLGLLSANAALTGNESAIATIQNYTDEQRVWGNIGGAITDQDDLIALVNAGGSTNLPHIHTQSTASSTWTVNHNRGTRGSATLLDLAGGQISAKISQPNNNQAIVESVLPITGILVLSF